MIEKNRGKKTPSCLLQSGVPRLPFDGEAKKLFWSFVQCQGLGMTPRLTCLLFLQITVKVSQRFVFGRLAL